MAEDHKCPECGAEIEDVRVTCPKCGYRYEGSDYEDTKAGNEFLAGSAIDDDGNELVDDPSGTGEEPEDEKTQART